MRCVADGMNFYYECYGEGTPVVFIHGFGIDHRAPKGTMEPVFKNHPGWKRIYFDMPGMGQTKASETIQNTDDMLEAILALINKLIPSGNFLIGGMSYGGLLARGVILRMPERVDGALLLAPVTVSERPKRMLPHKIALVKDEELLASLTKKERKEFELMSTVQNKTTWERYSVENVPALAIADTGFMDRIAASGFQFSFDVDQLMKPFVKPALIFMGRQDTAVGYRDGLRLIDNFPRGTFAILDRAGHSLEIEQETVVRCMAGEWLDRVEEYQKDLAKNGS
jgi:pimeloyl-ACP methyl ester carboxylesterase